MVKIKTGIERLRESKKNMVKIKIGNERLRESKKISDLDKYLIFSFSILIVYTIVELVLSTITGISHDTLTTCLYAAFGGETILCALIKKYKLQRRD